MGSSSHGTRGARTTETRRAAPRIRGGAAPAAALILAALCLRGPFAAVGPVVDELSDELSLSTAALAVVTSLPLVCFGLVSPFAPVLAGRLGLHRGGLAGMPSSLVGIALRLAGTVGLFVGTVVLTGGIAIVNVLRPGGPRRVRPQQRRRRRRGDRLHGPVGQHRRRPGPAVHRPDGQRRRRRWRCGACRCWPPSSLWRCWPAPGRSGPRHHPRPGGGPRSSATASRWR